MGTANYDFTYPTQKDNPLEARLFLDEIDLALFGVAPPGSVALADPGANGILARTSLGVTAAVAHGTGWLHNDGAGVFTWSTPTASNVGLGNVTNDAQTKASIVPNTLPSSAQILVGNAGGTAYAPVTVSGDVTISNAGVVAIGVLKITNAMLAGSNLVNAFTTLPESWIGPSATTGIYFKSGNVGIGTPDPGVYKLRVVTNTSGQIVATFKNDSVSGFSTFGMEDNAGTQQLTIGYANASAVAFAGLPYIYTGTGKPLTFQMGGTEKARILDTGNFGVGTTTPRKLADFRSTSQSQLRLTYTDNSVYSDFTVGSGGDLTIAPTGDFIFDPVGNDVLPATNYDLNLGSLSLKYLTVYAAELWVETLVAQDTMATMGGRFIVPKGATLLSADLAPAGTTITVKHNNLANGDRIWMESDGKFEMMAVTSAAGGSAGAYTYTVTRNLDGSGANQWYAGDSVVNTGTTGDGYIELYAYSGRFAGTGPTIVGNVRTGTTYNNIEPRWAIGNLNGLYGYGATTYGAAFGVPAATWLGVDSTNGIRILNSSTVLGQWDASGNITVGQVAASQSNIQITSGALNLRTNTTVYGSLSTAGVLTLGEVGAGKSNTLISAGDFKIRLNTTALFNVDTSGNVRVGTDISAAATTRLFISNASQTYNSEAGFVAGDVLFGDNTAASNKGNIKVTNAGQIAIRRGTTNYITLDATDAQFTNLIKMSGSSSAIAIGSTPPTSATVGTGIWLDRTGMYGLASSVQQAIFSAADGKITAGAGNVVIGATGIYVKATSTKSAANSYRVINSTGVALHGSVYGLDVGGTAPNLRVHAGGDSVSDAVSTLTLMSGDFTTDLANAEMRSDSTAGSLYFQVRAATSTFEARLFASASGFKGLTIGADATPTTSAILDLNTTTGALLLSRLTATQRDALTAANGMLIYNSTTGKFQGRAAGAWVDLH